MILDSERRYWLTCDCNDVEHQAVFRYWLDDEFPTLTLEVHLVRYGFFIRLVAGIKYIFGYKSRFGSFDEILVNCRDAKELRDFLDGFVSSCENGNEEPEYTTLAYYAGQYR